MKYNIITTMKKLEQLIMHMESSSDMAVMGSTRSVDQFITDEDAYVIDTAILSRSPDFVPLLLRLFKLTSMSKLDKKVRQALVVQGENVVEPMMGMLETEHGPRAAQVLAEIGSEQALPVLIKLADVFPDFSSPAIKLARKVGGDVAIDWLVSMLLNNKPFGFPQSILKKEENTTRIAATNIAKANLEFITGQKFSTADEWSAWWSDNKGK